MFRKLRLPAMTLLIALPAVLLLSASSSAIGCVRGHGSDFVQRDGSRLVLHGKSFRIAGTNNYYLMYSSTKMTDAVLDKAAASGFDVVRTWAWLDGTPKNGVWFQNFNGTTMTYNDGADGLQKLDYVVAAAGARGLKLVLPLTNNWSDFGGMDQYVAWAGDQYHSDFYTDPKIRTWFKNWISHLLNHTNSITGVKYKDDPTIMTWELANEPRCKGSGTYAPASTCNTSTITKWAAEMSAYIKSIDHNHLVSSGSEGLLCEPNNPKVAGDWTRDCSTGEGVDELAISKLPTIDVMSYHLYPDSWLKAGDPSWATNWIKEHIQLAQRIHKPSMLGEYGLKDKTARNPVYKSWTDTILRYGGTGALYWILSDVQDDGTLYPDYDGFTVYCPSPVCTTISNFAAALTNPWAYSKFPPVADNLAAITPFETPTTFNPAASAVAYGRHNAPVPGTIDLDSATAGQQTSLTLAGGTFALQTDGTVVFTPASGYHGDVTASYTIRDKKHRISNVATLKVTVKPQPGAPIQLFSFEDGTDGWTGAVSQSTAWASSGANSLLVSAGGGGWVTSVSFPGTGLDLSNGYSQLQIDALNATPNWGFIKMSIQAGPSWTWCENTGDSLQPNASGPFTATMSLLGTSCDLSQIHQLNLYLTTDTYIDNVRAN
ncbi:MAG: cellulase family glycosylhydrolase [Gaiellaceae bacterium]|jgi:mannan endo-1,4-beta-mannosidase